MKETEIITFMINSCNQLSQMKVVLRRASYWTNFNLIKTVQREILEFKIPCLEEENSHANMPISTRYDSQM